MILNWFTCRYNCGGVHLPCGVSTHIYMIPRVWAITLPAVVPHDQTVERNNLLWDSYFTLQCLVIRHLPSQGDVSIHTNLLCAHDVKPVTACKQTKVDLPWLSCAWTSFIWFAAHKTLDPDARYSFAPSPRA